nr:hypothetical protein [uncultured Mediterranean phage uvMED]
MSEHVTQSEFFRVVDALNGQIQDQHTAILYLCSAVSMLANELGLSEERWLQLQTQARKHAKRQADEIEDELREEFGDQ